MKRREWLELAALGALAPRLAGQPPAAAPPTPQRADDDQVIRLDVTRVNLLFTVSDKKGRFVTNLNKDDFEIWEGKRKQAVLEFAAESDLPLRIAMLIDTSNSIKDRFKFELEAAIQFLDSVIRKGQDRAIIYSYDTTSEVVVDFTDDTEHLAKQMRQLRPGGGTALYDAIYSACRDKLMMDTPRHKFRRAMIIIGDGDDNASKVSREQALEMAHKADVSIYSISTNITKTETDGDKILRYMSRETGGQSFFPFKAQDLAQDFENIANELRSQYSLLYRPEPMHTDGQYHEVDVRLRGMGKSMVIRARKGYYAPRM
jgi:VWFA-related protein